MFIEKKSKRGKYAGLTVMLLIGSVVAAGLTVAYLSKPNPQAGGAFEVEAGDGAVQVAENLKQDGVIRSELLFLRALQEVGLDQSLKPGVHDLSGVSSYAELASRLASAAKSLRPEVTLTVKEGWSLRDIKAELERLSHPAAAGFYEVTGRPLDTGYQPPEKWLERYPFLKTRYSGTSLEGFLFPDTYRIYADATAEDIVETMLDNFGRKMDSDIMKAVRESGHEFREVLVMASLVEREVRTMETRQRVADIFWRRLDLGMRLQADSTVNYVIGGKRPAVTVEQLQVDSPYNTYQNSGFPPGPIANPGLVSIKAVLSPLPNDYLFFLTDPEGGVHYATTFNQHVRNKQLYLR